MSLLEQWWMSPVTCPSSCVPFPHRSVLWGSLCAWAGTSTWPLSCCWWPWGSTPLQVGCSASAGLQFSSFTETHPLTLLLLFDCCIFASGAFLGGYTSGVCVPAPTSQYLISFLEQVMTQPMTSALSLHLFICNNSSPTTA